MSDRALRVQVNGLPQAQTALTERQRRMMKLITLALKRSGEHVLTFALENVTGKVLHIRSGNLARRMTKIVDEAALTVRVGTTVLYAPRHEFGFHEEEQVSGHFKRINKVFGKPVRTITAYWNPYTRMANTPERPFMRPALRSAKPGIAQIFAETLSALRKPA